MPCTCDGYDLGPSEKQIRHASSMAELMCKTCQWLEDRGYLTSLLNEFPEVLVWWREHQAVDAQKRKEDEERASRATARRQGLDKLTLEERAALGIRDV